jgi:transposase
MEEHIRALLQRFQYSEQFKETAAFRIVFGGETLNQVMADLDIHNSYSLRNWVSLYQRKLQTGLFFSPAMTRTQKSGRASLTAAQRQAGADAAAS